jgi:multiple sugar transport system ATP-binding protein
MGLGDRIAVLDKGRLQQLGTPQEIYHDPANTFVATFVGSPPMNLIEQDGVLVGFRPEQFLPESLVSERDGRVPFAFHVDRVEYLGSDRLLYGTIPAISPDTKVISRLPFTVTMPVEEGATAAFAAAESSLCFFSTSSGERVEPRPLKGVTA